MNPTVWTNTLVGVTLAGGSVRDPRMPILLVAMSLFYTGGMYLNDAFDREFDATHRPDRPIPAGDVGLVAAVAVAAALVAMGIALIAAQVEYWAPLAWALALVVFTAFLGFQFFSPFLPLYVQELGVTDPAQVAVWSGVLLAVTPGVSGLLGR